MLFRSGSISFVDRTRLGQVLNLKDCDALFHKPSGGPSAINLFDIFLAGGTVKDGDGATYQTRISFTNSLPTGTNGVFVHDGSSLTISISNAYWNSNSADGNNDKNIALLIHELGHAYGFLFGAKASDIIIDSQYGAELGSNSAWNNYYIDQGCFGGKLGWAKPRDFPIK